MTGTITPRTHSPGGHTPRHGPLEPGPEVDFSMVAQLVSSSREGGGRH